MLAQSAQTKSLRIAVDIGGTFTDGVATLVPDGHIWVAKSPTTPADPGEAVSTVILDLLDQVKTVGETAALELAEVVHGTTLVTNTLIERKGARTALVTTRGMRDALDIGREWRYDIYDLEIELPKPLIDARCRVELDERVDADGQIAKELATADLDRIASEIAALGVESVAVSLLHSYVNTEHEKAVEAHLLKALPGTAVSVSSDLAREIQEFERTSTVVASAYVKPIVAAYLRQLDERIGRIRAGVPLRIMVSSGGFGSAQAGAQSPILLLESGPAAGVLSALNTARQNGIDRVLAFDMGGTTAKACVAVGGEPPIAHRFECARVERFKRGSGLPILIPSIELIEIGAGGGSIAHVNRLGLLNIGPESSGSEPGPACYGRGGTDATVTDADLLLGFLNPSNFLGGEMALSVQNAEQAMERLGRDLGMDAQQVAWGICNIVNENMASAARIHIAENGYDPRDFTMVATGGAGPVHAVEVARKLRLKRVLIPIAAGAGSCLGMLAAPARVDKAWSYPQIVADLVPADIARNLKRLRDESEGELASAGASQVEWTIGADMRYLGQGAEVPVSLPYEIVSSSTLPKLLALFEEKYEKLYGRLVPDAEPQVITWRLVGRAPTVGHRFVWGDEKRRSRSVATASRSVFLPTKGVFADVPVYDRYSLSEGEELNGPLVLEERESTIVVALDAKVEVLADLTVSVTIREFEQ